MTKRVKSTASSASAEAVAQQEKSDKKVEFGDFQTPAELAVEICSLLRQTGIQPASALEPTCGHGSLLLAALNEFPSLKKVVGVDVNGDYVKALKATLRENPYPAEISIIQRNFLRRHGRKSLKNLPDPLLIIGNPPWVTNAALGSLGSANLPEKSNFQRLRGLDALTGKSNFDISEWMLIQILEWMDKRSVTLAMLCKTAVARKILSYGWKNGIRLSRSDMYRLDSQKQLGVVVDACLFVITTDGKSQSRECAFHEDLLSSQPTNIIRYQDGRLIAHSLYFERWRHLEGEARYKWRSGIKHDCSRVMELRKEGNLHRNGIGEVVDLEEDYLYPMLKSSEIAKSDDSEPARMMLVTQRFIGEATDSIRDTAPKTWAYLTEHVALLDRRGSTIYKGRPRFAVFGVGDYSFAPWKVAISGFYKKLMFKSVGPAFGRPTVFDDTCYFVACQTKAEAEYIASLLNSEAAQEFFKAFIFWDAKRPVTIDLLKRLDLLALAKELGSEKEMKKYLSSEELETRNQQGSKALCSPT